MQTIERKKNFLKSLFFSEKFLTFFLLAIIIALSVPLYKNFHRRQIINKKISDLEQEIKQAESKNSDLQKLIRYLESDQFVEEQARLNLNMKKPGESVAVIKEQANNNGDLLKDNNLAELNKNSGLSKFGYASNWRAYFFK